jgi:integrase
MPQVWFRTGSAYTSNGIVEFMKQRLAQLPDYHRIVFRADSGFFVGALMDPSGPRETRLPDQGEAPGARPVAGPAKAIRRHIHGHDLGERVTKSLHDLPEYPTFGIGFSAQKADCKMLFLIQMRYVAIPVDPEDENAMRARKATANRVLTVLKAGLNFAWTEKGIGNADEWRRVRPFREVDAPRVRYLATDEAARLINVCAPDFRELVTGALQTGCRYGELTRLVCSDFSPDGGTVRVAVSKSGKSRHVPLTDEGSSFFERMTAGRKAGERVFLRESGAFWGKADQARPLAEACKRVGIVPAVSFHILRHTYGALLAMQGVPLQVIAAALGHADTRMTERHYAHLQPDYVAVTIRQNLPSFGLDQDNVVSLRAAHNPH